MAPGKAVVNVVVTMGFTGKQLSLPMRGSHQVWQVKREVHNHFNLQHQDSTELRLYPDGEASKLEDRCQLQDIPFVGDLNLLAVLYDLSQSRKLLADSLEHMGCPSMDDFMEELPEHGEAAVPALQRILQRSVDDDTRLKAVQALQRVGQPAAVALTEVALNTRISSHLRAEATRALGKVGDANSMRQVAMATRVSKGGDFAVRREAILTLRELGPDAVPALAESLQDSAVNIRIVAVKALKDLGVGAAAAEEELLYASRDPAPAVSAVAKEALKALYVAV